MNLPYKYQRGNFTVEFAIVGIVFSLLIAFSGEIVTKLAIRGKLDRMAYSGATIIAERTQLFDEEYDVDVSEGVANYSIIKASLARTMKNFNESNFGYSLDMFTYSSGDSSAAPTTIYTTGKPCSVRTPSSNMLVTTGWGRSLSLYQVTLCYDVDNWYGGDSSLINSFSIALGR